MNEAAPVLQGLPISEFGGGSTMDLSEGWPCHLVSFSAWVPSSPHPCLPFLKVASHWVEKAQILELGRCGFEFQHPTNVSE